MTQSASSASSLRSGRLLWEMPLAMASWIFFHLNKWIIGVAYQQYLQRNSKRATTWRVLSQDTLAIPITLPVLMTKGPRWNTHGVIGTLGPFALQQQITLEVGTARRSAQSWTMVIYRYPDFKTVTQLSWLQPLDSQDVATLDLPAGRYSLGIRYYGLRPEAAMPGLILDGQHPIEGVAVPADPNQVYQSLHQRTNLYYRALHYYIYPMLRLRSYLPQAWVQREYLPVGDPDTTFLYDFVEAGDQLQVEVQPDLLPHYWVYLTGYNRASLPVLSQEITASTVTSPFDQRGFYLVRIRPKRSRVPDLQPQDIQISRQVSAAATDRPLA
ncbi:DUF6208 family protein [Lyngbya confervoides]|uniref:DUF6208 family protein n=1 Tax=Lyngbya confervoides BDU141951 TaxID=1574623 RepID=A0ABD4T5K7_9CYAN|nr:DUF6208 family protein [Lyngbya confervoides]MCM1983812.1 DUF6208 family protein [Lyngbya confervoides BDU141951]